MMRENTLGMIINNLGFTQTADQRYNNGYAHHTLAVASAFIRAFEERMGAFVSVINVEVLDAIKIPDNTDGKPEKLLGRSIVVERPIFENTMTLTRWIENFYQESPSINARAREDQRHIGEQAFRVPAMVGFEPWGQTEEKLEDG